MNKITPNSKIQAVVFDLDHTLYDRYETLKLVCHDFYTEKREWFSEDIDESEAAKIMAEADGRYIIYGWKSVMGFWLEKGLLKLDENGNSIATRQELFSFIWNYGFVNHAVAYPFANNMLDTLRKAGLKVALITNAGGEIGIKRQTAKLKLLGMTDHFDNILISGSVGIHKPERGIFDIMSARLEIPAANMLYVGDNPIADIKGAKGSGYIPVWVRLREEYGEKCDCEYSVADVSEIPSLVDKINSRAE